MAPRIKYIKHIAFTDIDLASFNPVLFTGEIACIIDINGKVKSLKIGPGNYNDLDPIVDIYPYSDIVTNQLGDILNGSVQFDRKVVDILRDILSPYVNPIITDVQNNASGAFQDNALLEIGLDITSTINVVATVTNQDNIEPISPLEVLAPDFNVNNPYPNAVISLTPTLPLIPSTVTVYSIKVRVKNNKNEWGPYEETTIKFAPRIFWGASTSDDLVLVPPATSIPIGNFNLLGGDDLLTDDFKNTYEINVGTYGYVLIPNMLNPINISWTDVTNPSTPYGIGMVNLGSVNINNGVDTYNYTKWRTPFSNINGIKLKAQ